MDLNSQTRSRSLASVSDYKYKKLSIQVNLYLLPHIFIKLPFPLFITCIFSLRVAFTGVPYGVPYGMCVPYRLILLYMFRGDAVLTMGPYGSTGTCIINYNPPEINVVMAKALFDCSSRCHFDLNALG